MESPPPSISFCVIPHLITREQINGVTASVYALSACGGEQRCQSLVDREAVEQAGAARAHQIVLAASSARMRRVPGLVVAAAAVKWPSCAVPVASLVQLPQVWSAESL